MQLVDKFMNNIFSRNYITINIRIKYQKYSFPKRNAFSDWFKSYLIQIYDFTIN